MQDIRLYDRMIRIDGSLALARTPFFYPEDVDLGIIKKAPHFFNYAGKEEKDKKDK